MKLITLSKEFLVCLFFIFCISSFSFGQNATNGGTIGIITIDSDTVAMVQYYQGELADTIINIFSASGGNNQLALEYQWAGGEGSSNFETPLPNYDDEFLIPPTDVPGTFFYHRHARRQGFSAFVANSNIVVIIVEPSNVDDGGLIGFDQTVMINEQPDSLLELEPPSGGNPNLDFEYEWEKIISPNMEELAEGINDQPFYVPPPLTETTTFRRKARREGFTDFRNSNQVTIEVEPTSIENLEAGIIQIHPNPVTDYLQIEFIENNSSDWQVDIFDVKGSLQKTISLENVNLIQTINLHDLTKGTYLIQITDLENNKVKNFKLLKE